MGFGGRRHFGEGGRVMNAEIVIDRNDVMHVQINPDTATEETLMLMAAKKRGWLVSSRTPGSCVYVRISVGSIDLSALEGPKDGN